MGTRLGLAIVTAGVALACAAPAAPAATSVSVSWETPTNMTVGQTASQELVIQNQSTAEETVTLDPMWFTPSCGAAIICETPDIGVFAVQSPATGLAAMCNEDSFPVVAEDTVPATGRVRLQPTPALSLLAEVPAVGPAYLGETCRIHIDLQVLRMPAYDVDPVTSGVQTRQALTYSVNGGGATGNTNVVTVNPCVTNCPASPPAGSNPAGNPRGSSSGPCASLRGRALALCLCKNKKSKKKQRKCKQRLKGKAEGQQRTPAY